ncbi:hypothetical protein DWB84_08645 [Saccharophagus sp. K07]|nr:hypothetical protein [Saccharophagus sp. K07]
MTIEEGETGFCEFIGIIESIHAGYTGRGYANTDNQQGVSLTWAVQAANSDTYSAVWRYANAGTANRPAQVNVNDLPQTVLNFPPTQAWTDWQTQTFNLELKAGLNLIQLIAASADGVANLDRLTLTGAGLSKANCPANTRENVRVFVVGDSTVANYNSSQAPMTGWGQILHHFFYSDSVAINNRAIGGRSSRSFYQEGRWQGVVNELNAGDYVLIQFGHNDRDFSKAERYTPPADFQTYLRMYVNEARNKGAIPVFVTPMVMNAYNNGQLRNVFTESGNDYRGAMVAVAQEMNVALLDLNQRSFELIRSVGQNYATRFIFMGLQAGEYANYPDGANDGTHFQEMGAVEMAGLITQALREQTRSDLKRLADNLKPRYSLQITANPANTGTITRSLSLPEGAPVTLKALPNNGNSFTRWSQNGNSISTNSLHRVLMPAGNTTYTAEFRGSNVTEYPAARVFLIGDSTVSDYNSGYYPMIGWGQVFGKFFRSDKITVFNRALSGRSSKSFYNDHWADVKREIRAGDFVFIQFGINDRNNADPDRYAPGNGVFQDYLTRFARETQALGATPIFVATLVRNAWDGNKVYPAYHEHPVVTRELGAQLGIPVVDLDGKSTALLESVGEEYSTYFYYMNLAAGEYPNYPSGRADQVHFQEMGAVEMARLVTEGLRESGHAAVAPLVAALKPTYSLTVNTTNPNAGLVTRGFQYPEGIPVTLKVRPRSGFNFVGWRNANGQTISTNRYHVITTTAAPATYTAVF